MAKNETPNGWDPIQAIQNNDLSVSSDLPGLLSQLCQGDGLIKWQEIKQLGLQSFLKSLVRDYEGLIEWVGPETYQFTGEAFEISERVRAAEALALVWQERIEAMGEEGRDLGLF